MNRTRLFLLIISICIVLPLLVGTILTLACPRSRAPLGQGRPPRETGRRPNGVTAVWNTETVESQGDVGNWTSLAVDSSGRPHVSYNDYDDHALKYAWRDGTSWFSATVDAAARVHHTSIALDSTGLPHISYCSLCLSIEKCTA